MSPDLKLFFAEIGLSPARKFPAPLDTAALRAVLTGQSDQWRPSPGDTEPPF